MAITVGTSEPAEFTVGDSVSWHRTEADYLPPAWNLVYGFTGPSRFTIASTDVGVTKHLLTMPTTGVKAGEYAWTVKATNGSSTITLASGTMTALPDLTATNTELVAAEAKLVLAEAAYAAATTSDKNSVSGLDGVSFTRRSLAEVRASVMYWRREVERLRNLDRNLLGHGTSQLYVTRFRN